MWHNSTVLFPEDLAFLDTYAVQKDPVGIQMLWYLGVSRSASAGGESRRYTFSSIDTMPQGRYLRQPENYKGHCSSVILHFATTTSYLLAMMWPRLPHDDWGELEMGRTFCRSRYIPDTPEAAEQEAKEKARIEAFEATLKRFDAWLPRCYDLKPDLTFPVHGMPVGTQPEEV